jgi:hypothetical protein
MWGAMSTPGCRPGLMKLNPCRGSNQLLSAILFVNNITSLNLTRMPHGARAAPTLSREDFSSFLSRHFNTKFVINRALSCNQHMEFLDKSNRNHKLPSSSPYFHSFRNSSARPELRVRDGRGARPQALAVRGTPQASWRTEPPHSPARPVADRKTTF